jgi:hypothetical protein
MKASVLASMSGRMLSPVDGEGSILMFLIPLPDAGDDSLLHQTPFSLPLHLPDSSSPFHPNEGKSAETR